MSTSYRTRIRTKAANEPVPATLPTQERNCRTLRCEHGDYKAGPPLVVPSSKTVTTYPTSDLLTEKEVIKDEFGVVGRRVKYCDHTKQICARVLSYEHCLPEYGATTSTDHKTHVALEAWLKVVTLSRLPSYEAWANANYGSIASFNTLTDSDLNIALGSAPRDRLGEIPAQLVSAMEQWHSTTTLIESSELPALAALVRKRGPIRGSLAAVNKFLRSRDDFCSRYRRKVARETVRNLAKDYREGQLGTTFGILPTVSDVRTISEVLLDGIKARRTRIVRTLNGKTELDKNANSSYVSTISGRWRRKEHVELFRVDGAVADLKRPDVQYSNMKNILNRLVGVNGAGLIWEVIPWSFVIDWFLSVDNALDTLWLQSQTDFDVSFWSSTKLSYRRSVEHQYVTPDSYPAGSVQLYRWASDPVWKEYSHYIRTPRPAPTAFESLGFRMGPKQGFLTILLALGLVPRSQVKKISK